MSQVSEPAERDRWPYGDDCVLPNLPKEILRKCLERSYPFAYTEYFSTSHTRRNLELYRYLTSHISRPIFGAFERWEPKQKFPSVEVLRYGEGESFKFETHNFTTLVRGSYLVLSSPYNEESEAGLAKEAVGNCAALLRLFYGEQFLHHSHYSVTYHLTNGEGSHSLRHLPCWRGRTRSMRTLEAGPASGSMETCGLRTVRSTSLVRRITLRKCPSGSSFSGPRWRPRPLNYPDEPPGSGANTLP